MIIGAENLYAIAADPRLEPAVDLFYFVRHGETEGNFTRIVQHPTIPLNERGRAQAQAAAALMAAEVGCTHIVASPFERAHETARAIAAATGLGLTLSDGLKERLFGELMGTSSVELDWCCEPKGGETLPEFVARTKACLNESLLGPGVPVVVAHGGVLRVLTAALGLPVGDDHITNATPLRFARDGGAWHMTKVGG